MTQPINMGKSWAKYGLSLERIPARQRHSQEALRASFAHELVADYLDRHPAAQAKYLRHEPGFRYMDILSIAELLFARSRGELQ